MVLGLTTPFQGNENKSWPYSKLRWRWEITIFDRRQIFKCLVLGGVYRSLFIRPNKIPFPHGGAQMDLGSGCVVDVLRCLSLDQVDRGQNFNLPSVGFRFENFIHQTAEFLGNLSAYPQTVEKTLDDQVVFKN